MTTPRPSLTLPAVAAGECGASIVTMMIVLVLTVVVVPISFGMTLSAVKARKSAELKRDVDDMRSYLRDNVGCRESFPKGLAAACGSGAYVTIRSRADGNGRAATLIAGATLKAPYTRWTKSALVLRAWCAPDPRTRLPRLLVQANRIAPSGKVLKDPLSGQLMDGTQPNGAVTAVDGWSADLFEGARVCK